MKDEDEINEKIKELTEKKESPTLKLKEALKIKHYIEALCWANSWHDDDLGV